MYQEHTDFSIIWMYYVNYVKSGLIIQTQILIQNVQTLFCNVVFFASRSYDGRIASKICIFESLPLSQRDTEEKVFRA